MIGLVTKNFRNWLLIFLLIFLVLGGVVYWLVRPEKEGSQFDLPAGKPEGQVLSEEPVLSWEDPAGFVFTYPKSVLIDPHEEDQESYAHLDLSRLGQEGGVTILVQETDFTDIEDWAAEELSAGQILNSRLDGRPAKKIAYQDPKRLVTAIIDVDALVLIKLTPDEKGDWESIYQQVLSSFRFVPLENEVAEGFAAPYDSGASGPVSNDRVIEEPEEVIE
ncbi:MAG: hypothetical protein JW991_02035 [Candidatus Pacebacteria bacterium]|nr:hypothetical protein [Candidatus Paceibacterota bacterium]